MSKKEKPRIKTKVAEGRKYQVCPQCGLNIRCGNVEAHEAGWHHNNKGYVKR